MSDDLSLTSTLFVIVALMEFILQFQKSICCVLSLVAFGCGVSSISGGGTAVSGTVTLDGEPLPYGVAEIQSFDSKTLARRAVITDGKFVLEGSSGLPAGKYSVRMMPYEPEVEELSQIPEDARRKINASRNLIPAKYQQPNALGIKVSGDSKNAFKFDLRTADAPAS